MAAKAGGRGEARGTVSRNSRTRPFNPGVGIGVRGQWTRLSYDFFVGAPIRKPEGYHSAEVTLGFNLNASN